MIGESKIYSIFISLFVQCGVFETVAPKIYTKTSNHFIIIVTGIGRIHSSRTHYNFSPHSIDERKGVDWYVYLSFCVNRVP